MEIATLSPNKLNMKKEIWAEIGKSDAFSYARLSKCQRQKEACAGPLCNWNSNGKLKFDTE